MLLVALASLLIGYLVTRGRAQFIVAVVLWAALSVVLPLTATALMLAITGYVFGVISGLYLE